MRQLAVLAVALIIACGNAADGPADSSPPPSTSDSGGTVPDNASPVFVETTDILLMESFPVQVALKVTGTVPTPCHHPVWAVEDDGSTIAVTLGSVADDDTVCAQVLAPVDISIPLGTFESGSRTVTVNGEKVGDFKI